MTGHVFIAVSLDGYIARPDGAIDWLIARDDPAEDHGYHDFIAGMDAILMGRGTYEKAATFDPWPYALPVVVLSDSLAGTPVPDRLRGKVRFTERDPAQAMRELEQRDGARRIYVDGGVVVQSCLRAGLIDDMVVTTVPVLIGAGRPLFGELPRDQDLALLSSRSFPSGLVQSAYRVLR